MKKNLLLTILLLSIFKLSAQYQSIFGTMQTSWNVLGGTRSYYTDSFYVVKDTLLSGQAYKLINQVPATAMSPGGPAFFLKEDTTGKVWHRPLSQDTNILIMDLSLQLGDSFDFDIWPYPKVDSVYTKNGKKHVRFGPKQFSSTTVYKHLEFIEGVGPNYGAFPNSEALLLCMYKDNQQVYQNTLPLSPWFVRLNDCAYYMIRESVDEFGNGFKTSLYPNPAANKAVISFSDAGNSAIALNIFNITGQAVYQSVTHHNDFEINLEHFPAGIYLYRLLQEGRVIHSGKLVKE